MIFADSLDIILTESNKGWRPMDSAIELMRRLDSAKQLVADIQHQLLSLRNRMNADLVLSIKRHMPALNVGLDKNGECKVGYKSKSLVFTPNIEQGVWVVTSSDDRFKNRFSKSKRKTLVISPNIDHLIEAIADFFSEHYKSLGEDIIGNGIIMVEGKISSLRDIVEWRDRCLTLKSRKMRQNVLQ